MKGEEDTRAGMQMMMRDGGRRGEGGMKKGMRASMGIVRTGTVDIEVSGRENQSRTGGDAMKMTGEKESETGIEDLLTAVCLQLPMLAGRPCPNLLL